MLLRYIYGIGSLNDGADGPQFCKGWMVVSSSSGAKLLQSGRFAGILYNIWDFFSVKW